MNSILIKQAAYHGGDTKLFRAYTTPGDTGLNQFGRRKDEPLGVSASTTSNTEFGALRCATKAFIKLLSAEHFSDLYEVETRVLLKPLADGKWQATLQPKTQPKTT